MGVYDIIQILSSLFWITLGIRQFRGTWGWYFMILGLTDFLSMFIHYWTDFTPDILFLASDVMRILALFPIFFEKNKIKLIPITMLLLYCGYYVSHDLLNYSTLITALVVFLFFIRLFVLKLFTERCFNIFFILVSFYSLITSAKIFYLIVFGWYGVDFHYLSTLFQIILMSPFLMILHDDERLSIKI